MTRQQRDKWGTYLLAVGIAAWIPYFVLVFLLGRELVVYPFLAAHLSGVIPGALLRHGHLVLATWRKLKPASGGSDLPQQSQR